MWVVRSAFLSFFATVGILSSILLTGYVAIRWLLQDDQTRVVAVIAAPSGRQAAVVYLHHIDNLSTDVLAVKLSRPPYPQVGTETEPTYPIAKVFESRILGWWTRPQNGETDKVARELISVSWQTGQTEVIDVCPVGDAVLVGYEATGQYGSVTLCRKAAP